MGVLPLQYVAGTTAASLGLSGLETYAVRGLTGEVVPGQEVAIEALAEDGRVISFPATLRVDGVAELDYLRAGGVLNLVLADMLRP